MDFSDKCLILSGLYSVYKQEPSWQAFCYSQDVGLPLAYLIVQDLVEPSEEGIAYVDETWEAYCTFLDIDADAEYESLEETFLASPLVTLKEQ